MITPNDMKSSAIITKTLQAVAFCILIGLQGFGCTMIRAAETADARTVAVMGFADTSEGDHTTGFNRALQEMLTTDLAVSREVRVVERNRLEEVLKEQRLGRTEFLDQSSAARVGKGLGAEAILTGSVWIQADEMRIDARLVHVETGQIILPAKIVGKATAFLDLEKDLATQIVDAMGARLSAFEKASLSKRHTSDIAAATAFGQALQAEDAGDTALAREKACVALELDPNFALAAKVVRDIDSVLEKVRAEDLQALAEFVAVFELKLLDWPLYETPDVIPEYRRLLREHGPKRALLEWLERAEERQVGGAWKQPTSLIFADPYGIANDRGPGRAYLNGGAGDIVTFWCDVAQSDPERTPQRPLTQEDLKPARFLWLLPDIYTKRFAAAVTCSGDFALATRIAREYADMCRAMGPDATLYPQLEHLRGQLADPEQRDQLQLGIRENRTRWMLVKDRILDVHVISQAVNFGRGTPPAPPSLAAARKQFEDELLSEFRFVPPHEQRRLASLTIAKAVAAVAPADFVACPLHAQSPVVVAHVAGCPSATGHVTHDRARPLQRSEECIGEGMLPCGICRPLRWVDRNLASEHLAKIGPPLLDKALETKGQMWPGGLEDFLLQFPDAPSAALRPRLIQLALAVADADGEYQCDRTRQRCLFQCVARVAGDADVDSMTKIISDTDFYDVRASAGAVLGAIGSPAATDAITVALREEPFYFVRHSLEASLVLAVGSQWTRRVNAALGASEEGNMDEALASMTRLIAEVNESATPRGVKQMWQGRLHMTRGDLRRAARHPATDVISDYRKAVSLLEEESTTAANALNSLAYVLALERLDLETAEATSRRAVAMQGRLAADDASLDDTAMLDTLALVLLERGKLDEAKTVIVKCVDRPAGQSLEIYDHYGDILWALDEQEAAKDAWTRGLALTADTPDDQTRAERVRTKLAR